MPSNRSLFKARKLADRCNREREQIEALETRLYELRQKHTRTHAAMYEALPEGFFVSLSPTEPWEIVGPAGGGELRMPHPFAYNFNYWTCEDCAHVVASPPEQEAPSRCENCGSSDICGFVSLEDAEEYSQEILDARS